MAHRIIIAGGGISGLAAAHRLVELGREKSLQLELTLLEAGGRLGGSIATERVDGFLVESGPDSFISEKPWALNLCQRLGITSGLISPQQARQNLYVVRAGTLQPLPEGFILVAPTRFRPLIRSSLFSWTGKLRMALDLFLPRGGAGGDESLGSFVRRRLGAEVLERLAQPLIGGIYAADPDDLSLSATMPRFLEMERSRRSIIWSMWLAQRRRVRLVASESGARWGLFVTLRDGMQSLVETLAARLPKGTARAKTKVIELAKNDSQQGWTFKTDGGGKFAADGVILATPAYAAAEALAALDPELTQELNAIPYSSTATVNLAYKREDIPGGLDGFGLVVPAIEKRSIIACSFSSVKYPNRAPDGYELVRAFVGGATQPELFHQDDRSMETSVRKELAALLGIKAEPVLCRINRHPRALPQYRVGHPEKVRRIDELARKWPALALAGNAYRGIGIADSVHSGELAAEKVLAQLTES